MNTADWNLEAHSAQEIEGFYQLGSLAAIPPGQSVVESTARFRTSPKRSRSATRIAQAGRRPIPETKCYLPGIPRATYMPYPFQIVQGGGDILFAYEYDSANRDRVHEQSPGAAGRHVDGVVERPLGRRHARDRDHRLQRHDLARPLRQLPQRLAQGDGAAISKVENTISNTRRRSRIPTVFSRPWTISMPLYRRLEPNAEDSRVQMRAVRRGVALQRFGTIPLNCGTYGLRSRSGAR